MVYERSIPLSFSKPLKKIPLLLAVAVSLSACVTGGGSPGIPGNPLSGTQPGGSPASNPASTPSPTAPSSPAIPITGSTIPNSVALVVPGAGSGTTYYVSTTGSDGNDGLSPQTAFQTIQHAVETVGPGGTIEILGGTYSGGITIDHPGTPTGWITMEPYQNQQVIIDGTGSEEDIYFYTNGFVPDYWEVKGLTFAHAGQYEVKIDVPDVKVVNNDIYGSDYSLVKLVSTASNVVIWGNQIHDNNTASPLASVSKGVDMVGSQNVLVAHNNVYNISFLGLYAKGNARNITFEDNTLNNIGSRGIMLGESTGIQFLQPGETYESYDSIIKNNVITNDQSACLAESSSYNAEIYNNSCYNTAISRHGAIMISNESALGQAGTNVYVRNNIIYDLTPRPMEVIAHDAMTDYSTLHIDHNLYYNPSGVTFEWDDNNIYGVDLSSWQQTTGMDAYSQIADPVYASLTLLTLTAGSPAINAGVALASVLHDFNGLPRPSAGPYDLGAYQSSQ
ncbi:MAG: right-handed parallel beta-helix repeat-containing protein [Acidiferrobacteraceae bacterium]